MNGRLRILHLEDEPNDAELVTAALLSDGLVFEMQTVCDRQTFVAALDRGSVDLVLSDFAIPGFDGLSALKIAREKAPGVPFVFVSGTIGEEAAIESLRGGATDYVLKHRLSRLAPVVLRALREAAERAKRKDVEEALDNERQFLKTLLESLEVGIVACNSEGTLTYLNRATREFHGLPAEPTPDEEPALLGNLYQPDGRTRLDKDAAPLSRALRGEHVRNLELTIVPRNGLARTVLASGQPIIDARGRKLGAVVAMHDITERKLLEAQLQHSQKLEAIGQLAGGVAHDFNNLLSVVMGYCEISLADLTPRDPLWGRLEQILRAAERAASLTRQLLTFSRKQVIEPKIVDLNSLLRETQKMLRRLIGEHIEMVTRLDGDLGRVKADPGHLEQILVNLSINARDAMPDGGTLTLLTLNVELDEEFARRHADVRPGPHVMLAVTDTGVGMESEVQARIFEPFFTTKKDKGTGLGLATVYGIVKQSEGHISVESVVGSGTTFRIYLPRVERPVGVPERSDGSLTVNGTETVLVVEDDEALREFIRDSLEGHGYTVYEASDVEQSEEVCRRRGGPIHLVVVDVVLPGGSGADVVQRLTRLFPDVKVLYTSGHTDDVVNRHGILGHGAAFLEKPYGVTVLALKVREVLDAREEAATVPPGRRRSD